VRLCELVRERDDLERRIVMRVEQMLRDGLVAEVRRLLDAGLLRNPSAAKAIGYRETVDCLAGRLAESELAATIARNTRALVKKQRTWFKTQLPEHRTVAAATARPQDLF
jgi:tRNA dimethylallyltransferase